MLNFESAEFNSHFKNYPNDLLLKIYPFAPFQTFIDSCGFHIMYLVLTHLLSDSSALCP